MSVSIHSIPTEIPRDFSSNGLAFNLGFSNLGENLNPTGTDAQALAAVALVIGLFRNQSA